MLEYCSGNREKPSWTIGELDFGATSIKIDTIQNILLVKEPTENSAMEALRNGRFFVTYKGAPSVSNISFKSGSNNAIFGEEIAYDGKLRISFNLDSKNNKPEKTQVSIIRDGVLLNIIECQTGSRVIYEDESPLSKGKHYYRIVINPKNIGKSAVFNPVFVNKKQSF